MNIEKDLNNLLNKAIDCNELQGLALKHSKEQAQEFARKAQMWERNCKESQSKVKELEETIKCLSGVNKSGIDKFIQVYRESS